MCTCNCVATPHATWRIKAIRGFVVSGDGAITCLLIRLSITQAGWFFFAKTKQAKRRVLKRGRGQQTATV
jgi:hypothetical protein